MTKTLNSGPVGAGLFHPTGSAGTNAFIGSLTGAPSYVAEKTGAPK
jgi:hypothetical protein